MYKEATRKKLRFQTEKGSLTVEQLWDLDLDTLNNLAVSLDEAYSKSKGKSFLETKTTKDKEIKSHFDIVLDVLQTKMEESKKLSEAKADKEHDEKIIELIKRKQTESFENLSIEELEGMLKKKTKIA